MIHKRRGRPHIDFGFGVGTKCYETTKIAQKQCIP